MRRPQRFMSRSGRGALAAERFCARCGSRDGRLEKHHWAPRAVFDDADEWPMSFLCGDCHDAWHRKMGRRPRVTARRIAASALRERMRALIYRAGDDAGRAEHADFLWSRYLVVAELMGRSPAGRPYLGDVAEEFKDGSRGDEQTEFYRTEGHGYGASCLTTLEELEELLDDLIRDWVRR